MVMLTAYEAALDPNGVSFFVGRKMQFIIGGVPYKWTQACAKYLRPNRD